MVTPLGLGLFLGSAALTKGARNKLRFVASVSEVNENIQGAAASSGNLLHKSRRKMYIGVDVKENTIRALSRTIGRGTAGVTYNGGQFAQKASFEADGVVYGPVLTTVPAASAETLSDAITHPAITSQTQIWNRRVRQYEVGGVPLYRQSTGGDVPATTGNTYLRGAAGGNTDDPAGALVTTGFTSLGAVASGALVGEPAAPGLFFMCIGASGEKGANDAEGDGENGAGGYVRRGFYGHTTKYPLAMEALPGQSAADYVVDLASMRKVFKYANRFLLGHLGNDFSSAKNAAGGSWNDTMAIAAAETAWDAVMQVVTAIRAESPGAYIAQIDMSPKVDAPSGATSDANQSPQTGFLAFRTRIRELAADAISAGTLRAVVSLNSVDESATKPGVWASPGGVSITSDLVHRTAAQHGVCAPVLMAQLASPFMGSSMLSNPTL